MGARPCASCKCSAGCLGSSAGRAEDGDVAPCPLPSQRGCAALRTSSDKLRWGALGRFLGSGAAPGCPWRCAGPLGDVGLVTVPGPRSANPLGNQPDKAMTGGVKPQDWELLRGVGRPPEGTGLEGKSTDFGDWCVPTPRFFRGKVLGRGCCGKGSQ